MLQSLVLLKYKSEGVLNVSPRLSGIEPVYEHRLFLAVLKSVVLMSFISELSKRQQIT